MQINLHLPLRKYIREYISSTSLSCRQMQLKMVKNRANSSLVRSNLFNYFSFIFLLRLFVYVFNLFEFVAKPAQVSPPHHRTYWPKLPEILSLRGYHLEDSISYR